MPEIEEPGVTPEPEPTPDDDLEPVDPPAENDPDKGAKDALVAEREARRKEREERKQLRDELAALKQQLADKDKPADEAALDAARREAETAANERANERIVKAELRAAAAGKVSNLTALTRLADVSQIDVDQDGNPSADDIEDAITQFLTDFPEFAADKSKFTGSADQGSKGKQTKPGQLTQNDLKNMSPEQINAARDAGLLDKLLGLAKP